MGSALLFLLGPPLSPSGAGAKVVGSWSEEAEAEVSGGNPSFLPSLALTYVHMRIRESVPVPTRLENCKVQVARTYS